MNHVELIDCPYKINAWKRAVAGLTNIPDRLKTNNVVITTTLPR